jgi:hypothetical protein
MSGGRIQATAVELIDEDGVAVARGVVAIDVDEGAPPAIFWNGELYLKLVCDGMLYRRGRAMFAGASFQAVPR